MGELRLFLPNIKMLSGKSLSIKKSNALSHTSFFLLILWGPIVGLRPPGPSLSGSFKQGMLGKEERQANYAKKLPYNFSWIEPRRLAGTSIPSTVAQLEGLVREGVSHLVSLSPRHLRPPSLSRDSPSTSSPSRTFRRRLQTRSTSSSRSQTTRWRTTRLSPFIAGAAMAGQARCWPLSGYARNIFDLKQQWLRCASCGQALLRAGCRSRHWLVSIGKSFRRRTAVNKYVIMTKGHFSQF